MNDWRAEARALRRQNKIGYVGIYRHLVTTYPDITESMVRRECEKAFLPEYFTEKSDVKEIDIEDLEIRKQSTLEINKDGTQTSNKLIFITSEDTKNPDFLLKAHGYDVKAWELVSARNNIWNVYSKRDGISDLYSSKISVKPRTDTINIDEIKEHFADLSKTYKTTKLLTYTPNESGKLLEIPIMDLHLGKLGWSGEVGENFDHHIAEERFIKVIADFLHRTKCYKFEKVIFPVGQDFFNFDTVLGTTTGGTPQDNDLRWQKLFLRGVELLIKAIDMISSSTKAPIEVFYVGGNHDKMTSFYSTLYLFAWYSARNPNINVSTSPTLRKYVEYGNNLIGFSHGQSEKNNIDGIMQIEAREIWGRTRFHEWHLGHLHSEQTFEKKGLIIRRISSITGTDAWHNESGFIGAVKKAQAFVWDKEYGLTDILNSVIT